MIVLQCGNNIIQLRSPSLRSYEFDFKVSYLRDMTSALHTRKQTPAAQIHFVDVEILTFAKLNEFRAFLFAASGKQMTYIDNESRSWQVRLLDDPVGVRTGDHIVKGTCQLKLEGTYSG